MDGAPRLTAEVALNKAYSVAVFNGMPTDRVVPQKKTDRSPKPAPTQLELRDL